MNNQYALYAKGFVGNQNITHQVILSAKEVQTVGVSTQWQQSQLHIANKDVIKAFVALRQFPINSEDFDFRAQTIAAVMKSFGGPYLDSWFAANYLMGRMSDSRIQFLNETVQFVMGGERPYPVDMYLSYIGMATDHASSPKSFCEPVTELLNCSDPHFALNKNTVKTTEFVQSWLARPGGFRDLVTSAMVMWGDDTVA